MMSIEEAHKVGLACLELYPPTNPIVLARAIAALYASHEMEDRLLAKSVIVWLYTITVNS